jgi:hypothetical protein
MLPKQQSFNALSPQPNALKIVDLGRVLQFTPLIVLIALTVGGKELYLLQNASLKNL